MHKKVLTKNTFCSPICLALAPKCNELFHRNLASIISNTNVVKQATNTVVIINIPSKPYHQNQELHAYIIVEERTWFAT